VRFYLQSLDDSNSAAATTTQSGGLHGFSLSLYKKITRSACESSVSRMAA